jgi:hypothetical protein
MPNVNPVIGDIRDDDPQVIRVLAGLRKPVLKLTEVIEGGPHGRTGVYEDINAGLLVTFTSRGRRFAYAVDYARYLVALRRVGELDRRPHHLAKAEKRPARDPKSVRALCADPTVARGVAQSDQGAGRAKALVPAGLRRESARLALPTETLVRGSTGCKPGGPRDRR